MTKEEISHEVLIENVRDGHVTWEEKKQDECFADLMRILQSGKEAKFEYLRQLVADMEVRELRKTKV